MKIFIIILFAFVLALFGAGFVQGSYLIVDASIFLFAGVCLIAWNVLGE